MKNIISLAIFISLALPVSLVEAVSQRPQAIAAPKSEKVSLTHKLLIASTAALAVIASVAVGTTAYFARKVRQHESVVHGQITNQEWLIQLNRVHTGEDRDSFLVKLKKVQATDDQSLSSVLHSLGIYDAYILKSAEIETTLFEEMKSRIGVQAAQQKLSTNISNFWSKITLQEKALWADIWDKVQDANYQTVVVEFQR